MAAPGATFRRLPPLSRLLSLRPVAVAAAVRPYGVRASGTGELVTHTGQVYEEKDYRRVRFVGRQKEVNQSFAIDLIAEQPVSEVEQRVIACDGGGGALGHPKVYINLEGLQQQLAVSHPSKFKEIYASFGEKNKNLHTVDKDTKTGTCGYCGLQFKQKHH